MGDTIEPARRTGQGPSYMDPGLATLEHCRERLQIDERWTTRAGEREFAWIGHRLQQRFAASGPIRSLGLDVHRVHVRTRVVEGVGADADAVSSVLGRLNRHTIGGAYVYAPAERTVEFHLTSVVHAQTQQWRAEQVASLSACQLILAENEADWLAEVLAGRVAVHSHAQSGRRQLAAHVLDFIEDTLAQVGASPSRFRNESEFEAIAEWVADTPCASFGGTADGVCIEVACGEDTVLAVHRATRPHRRAGSGLRTTVWLPDPASFPDAARLAAALNRKELEGRPVEISYGAWCVAPARGGYVPVYQQFIPNALYRSGVSQDATFGAIKRARWYAEVLFPAPAAGNRPGAWARIAARLGFSRHDQED